MTRRPGTFDQRGEEPAPSAGARHLLGAAAFVAFVLLGASTADAQMRRCPDGCTSPEFPDCCDGLCTNHQIDVGNCGACDRRCAPGQLCRGGSCIVREGPQGPLCEPACAPDQVCLNAPGQNVCCNHGLACLNTCYDSPPNHCDQGGNRWCCGGDQACCAGRCCDPGSSCLPAAYDPQSGSPCCPNERVCGAQCCWGDTECLAGTCRPRCHPPCTAGKNCLDAGDPASGFPPTCCPAEQTWDVQGASLCCAPENRWLAPMGQVTVPECCPPAERWQEGAQCCPPERRPDPRFNCCGPGTLAAIDSTNPTGKICCPEERECNGVCCDYFENCVNGVCQPAEEPCAEPCGADETCCEDGERCVEGQCVAHTLSGIWLDEAAGLEVRIVQSGDAVTATYLEPRPCEHEDGTGATTLVEFNFAGAIEGNRIDGELGTCKFGSADAGPVRSPLRLAVADDLQALSGEWWNEVEQRWVPIGYRKLQDEPGPPVG